MSQDIEVIVISSDDEDLSTRGPDGFSKKAQSFVTAFSRSEGAHSTMSLSVFFFLHIPKVTSNSVTVTM